MQHLESEKLLRVGVSWGSHTLVAYIEKSNKNKANKQANKNKTQVLMMKSQKDPFLVWKREEKK